MRGVQFRNVLLLIVCVCGLGLLPGASRAQAATPIPLQNDFPPEFCTPQEILAGDTLIKESPDPIPLVSPANAPNTDMYFVDVTLPPHTCVSFTGHDLHDGAAIWFVKSGSIEFQFQFILDWPFADLGIHLKHENPETVSGVTVLEEGEWVSADRAVHYSYRNTTDSDAIVTMTVIENRVNFLGNAQAGVDYGAGCKGVCRRR